MGVTFVQVIRNSSSSLPGLSCNASFCGYLFFYSRRVSPAGSRTGNRYREDREQQKGHEVIQQPATAENICDEDVVEKALAMKAVTVGSRMYSVRDLLTARAAKQLKVSKNKHYRALSS